MYRIPKYGLRTRGDYDLLQGKALNGELRPADVQRLSEYWQGLLGNRWHYEYDRELGATEQPDGAEPDYIVIEREDEAAGTTQRVQLKRVEDLTALDRLGFTVSDVQQKISELEAL